VRPGLGNTGILDIALVNARVWTGDCGGMLDAVGIASNRVGAMGAAAVRAGSGRATRVIDCGGAFVMAAFIDCHTHFLSGHRT
jgi:predicted amidohydrolase YtcJ